MVPIINNIKMTYIITAVNAKKQHVKNVNLHVIVQTHARITQVLISFREC